VQAALTRMRLVAGAMAVAVAVSMLVLWQFLASGGLGEGGEEPIAAVLVVVAALFLVAAPVAERLLLARGGPRQDEAAAVQGYLVAKVVSLALREAVGLLGFVVGFLTGRLLWGLAIGAASLLAMALAWPRRADLASRPGDLPPPAAGGVEPR
jgi:hypothetical protein